MAEKSAITRIETLGEGGSGRAVVLILDDERLVRFTNGVFFRQQGFEVIECSTPEEAVGVLHEKTVDVIVSDVSMGDVDGFMFRGMVRRFNKSIPIVFLTAMVNDVNNEFLVKLMEDVHSYYVSKSASRQYLVSTVKKVMEAYRLELDVQRAKLDMEKSLKLASCVQRSMLPHWSRISKVYTYSSTIRPYAAVSGDLMEWYRPTEDSALAILGDISGHGTNAALAMTAVQAFLKQYKHIDKSLARRIHSIANKIQEFMAKNLRGVAYLAGTIIYVDFGEGYVRYLNCGNPEPYITHLGDGKRRIVNPENKGALPIGMIRGTVYTEADIVEFPFGPADVYIQYSDGVSDVSSDPEGNDKIPREVLDDIFQATIKDQPEDGSLVCEVPYRIMGAITDIGYTCPQDDMSIVSFSPYRKWDGMTYMHRIRMLPEKIDAVCETCGMWVADRFKSEELGVKTQLLLNEHLMNIYRHGYDTFERQREVCVLTVSENAGMMDVSVWDRGSPWNEIGVGSYSAADEKLDIQNEILAAGGRGQAIMTKICDHISRNRTSGLNRTVFSIKLPEEYLGQKKEVVA